MVAEAKARLSLDSAPFVEGMKGAADEGENIFDKGMKKIGGAIAAAFTVDKIIQFGSEVIRAALEIDDLSKKLGISTDAVQALKIAAEDSGASFSDVEQALKKLSGAINEAQTGNEDLAAAFRIVGLDAADLESMNLVDIFDAIANQVATSSDNAELMHEVFKLIGNQSGQNLKSTLQELGRDGLQPLIDKLNEANRIMGADSISKVKRFDESIKAFQDSLKSFALDALAALDKVDTTLDDIANQDPIEMPHMDEMAVSFREATEEHDKLVKQQKDAAIALQIIATEKRIEDEKLKKLNEEILKVINDQMTTEEKLKKSLEDLNDLESKLQTMIDSGTSKLSDQKEVHLEILKKRGEVKDLEEKLTKENGTQKALLDEQKRAADEINRIKEKTKDLAERIAENAFNELDTTDKISFLEDKRAQVIAKIADLERQGMTDGENYIDAKHELLDVEEQIADLNDEQAKSEKDKHDSAVKSVEEAIKLRKQLKALSDEEIKELLSKLEMLANGLAKLPKIDIEWISDLANLKFKGMTDAQARQMVRALTELANGLNGLPKVKKDLFDFLKDLENLKFQSLTDSQARQMVRSISTLINGLKDLPKLEKTMFDALYKLMLIDFGKLDKEIGKKFADGLEQVARGLKSLGGLDKGTIMSALELIGALKDLKSVSGGDYTLKIELPEGMESGVPLVIETAFNENVKSISTSLSELVKMKGIVWA